MGTTLTAAPAFRPADLPPGRPREAAPVLECVINLSEGRDLDLVEAIAASAGGALLDVHADPDHHRSVVTVLGEEAARAVASSAVTRLDLRGHDGVHPRLGVVDVVPFIALGDATPDEALAARDRFARWLATEHGVPCFTYGPERSLPDVRRGAFVDLVPDTGPSAPHPTAGATAVGARQLLVAYNVWLTEDDVTVAKQIASAVRAPGLRALGLQVGDRVQVSMNLIEPGTVGPAAAYDRVAHAAAALGASTAGAELVGLVPAAVLDAVPRERWAELDLDEDRTIEARVARRASGGGAGATG
jgi:glutamate formiminotransferase